MTPDGKNILMVAPGFIEYGEFNHSQNHQFGMMRAAAWLKARHGCDVSYVEGGLPPVVKYATQRLKERHPGQRVGQMKCGNYEQDGISKFRSYYGRSLPDIRNDMARAPSPDEVWIGSGLTYHWETTSELVEIAQGMFPSTRVRVGGIYPSLCGDHARAHCPGADIWEGEIPGAVEHWPDYGILPYQVPFRTVKWNSGCTVSKQCSFCAVKTLEPKFKVRPPPSLEGYLREEMSKGVRMLRIWASQLLQPPQAFGDLMDRLYSLQVETGCRLQVFASEGIQPSLFTPDMAERMINAGFQNITIPMESIEPETLEAFNKPSGISDYHRAVEIAKEAGFGHIGIFIMIGTPQQTLDEVVHAVVDCWWRRVSPVMMKHTIIPGSQDWDDFEWVHKGKDLHHLHPSLWASARSDLRVMDLEEIIAIVRMGYDGWASLPQVDESFHRVAMRARTKSTTDALFMKWCKIYGLHRNGRFRNISEASPHEPTWGRMTIQQAELLQHSVGDQAVVSMAS
jgi:hypothetical protein